MYSFTPLLPVCTLYALSVSLLHLCEEGVFCRPERERRRGHPPPKEEEDKEEDEGEEDATFFFCISLFPTRKALFISKDRSSLGKRKALYHGNVDIAQL